MVPRQNLQVVAQGLAWLTWQFQQPNVRAWLAALLQPFQDLENAAWGVLTQRFLNTAPQQVLPATNVVFDYLGLIVGQPRAGLSDGNYVSLITLRVAANRAIGAAPDWSNFARILAPSTSGPAGFWGDQSGVLFCLNALTLNAYLVAQVLTAAVPNGQHGVFAYTTWRDGSDQAFGSVYDTTSGQQGYGSVYDSTAGGGVASGASL